MNKAYTAIFTPVETTTWAVTSASGKAREECEAVSPTGNERGRNGVLVELKEP